MSKVVKDIKQYAKKLVYGRDDFAPNINAFLKQHGDKYIIGLELNRNPVSQMITKFLKTLTKVPYDKLFHLQLFITLNDGKKFMMEKNAQINIGKAQKTKQSDSIFIHEVPNITLNEFIGNARVFMGNKFIPYHASNSNCQDFILGLLHGNNINVKQYDDFIKQNAQAIFKNKPNLRKLTNTVTDIANRSDILVHGGGMKPLTWIDHVKEFSNFHQISYKDALQSDECQIIYHNEK